MNKTAVYLSERTNEYINLLIHDFKQNAVYAKLLKDIFFKIEGDYSTLEDFLSRSTNIEGFINYSAIKGVQEKNNFSGITALEHIQFKSSLFPKYEMEDKYRFFAKYEYLNILEALDKKEHFDFFCIDNYFYKEVDKLFLSQMPGYKKINNDIYEKKVTSDYSLIFDCTKKHRNLTGPGDYTYPLFFVKFKEEHHQLFLLNVDLLTVTLISPREAFSEFRVYYDATNYGGEAGPNVSNSLNKNEPVVEYDSLSNQYIVTNTEISLKLFNKFIYLSTELFVHYFKIFEEWLIKCLHRIES